MSSLPDRQRRFAAALIAEDAPSGRMAIYRHSIRRNYRNALGATYPVVKALVGAAFFDAAVDALVAVHASTSADLNVYGDRLARFLEGYVHAAPLPYLPDVARLEWAIDEVHRAADVGVSPEDVLGAFARVPSDTLGALHLRLAPACRLVASRFPILAIWRSNQRDYAGDRRVDLDDGGVRVLVRRDAAAIPLERLNEGDYAFLSSLASAVALGHAVERATSADPTFDLAASLRKYIASSTIVGTAEGDVSGSTHAADQ